MMLAAILICQSWLNCESGFHDPYHAPYDVYWPCNVRSDDRIRVT